MALVTPTDVLVERVRELLIAWGTHLHKYREREDALNDLDSLAARIRELETPAWDRLAAQEVKRLEAALDSMREERDEALANEAGYYEQLVAAEAQLAALREALRAYELACATMEEEAVFRVMANGEIYAEMVAEARALAPSVDTRCSRCGAFDEDGDGIPRCRHFRRNRQLGWSGPVALGRLEAWFVKRGLRPLWWPW